MSRGRGFGKLGRPQELIPSTPKQIRAKPAILLINGTIMPMLVLSFFSWWYSRGWKQVFNSFGRRLNGILDAFSVKQLLRTLFSPWRRIISYPGASLGDKMRAWGDNMVSRVIGFFVRIFVLLGAVVALVVIGILTIFELIAWPLLPLAIPGLFIAGLLI